MIRILFLSANPINEAYLKNIKEYKNSVDNIILSTKYRDEFRLEQGHEISLSELLKYLERFKPTIVHFTGHGSEDGSLVFQNSISDQKEKAPVGTIEEIFRIINVDKNIKCVVLSACYAEAQGQAISNYVPCVVGMSGEISLDAAAAFNVGFYSGLGNGYELQRAFDAGRSQIQAENLKQENVPQIKFSEVEHSIGPKTILVEGEILERFSQQASSYGFELLTNKYFQDHRSQDDELEDWKSGSSFQLTGIKEGKEFERKDLLTNVSTRLEKDGSILLVGGHGTSKSTLFMQTVCRYLEEGYKILYNRGSDGLHNPRQLPLFIEKILSSGYKLIIAVDGSHEINRLSIFYVMDCLKSYKNKEAFKFILTGSLPQLDLLSSGIGSQGLDKEYEAVSKRYITNDALRVELPYLTKDEIKGFLKKFKPVADEKSLQLEVESCYQQTTGHPAMVKFFAFPAGVTEYVNKICQEYLFEDRISVAAIVCLLIDMAGFRIRRNLLNKMGLTDERRYLDHVMVTQNAEGYWETLNPKWNIEFLSVFFSVNANESLTRRKQHFNDALEKIFQVGDQELSYSATDAIYRTPLTNDVRLNILAEPIALPDYLNDEIKQDLLLTMAYAYTKMGRPNVAIECLDRRLGINSKDIFALYNKNVLLRKSGRYNEAIACLDELLKEKPKWIPAWKEKASYFYKMGRYHEAKDCFVQTTVLDPEEIAAWNGLGLSLSKLTQYEEAINCFDQALRLKPGELDQYDDRAIIYFNKGVTLEYWKKYSEAKDCFQEAAKIEPKLAPLIEKGERVLASAGMSEDYILDAFGWVSPMSQADNTGRLYSKCELLRNSSKFEDALECYDRVLKIDPKFPGGWHGKGMIYETMGKYDQAEKCFSEVIAIAPDNPIGWYNKGKSLRKQDRNVEALECFNRTIALDPSIYNAWVEKTQLLIVLNDPKYGSLEEALRKLDSLERNEKPAERETRTEEEGSADDRFEELIQEVRDIKQILLKLLDKVKT
jgi:tetratricopeptide (TPR) repeat protein